MFPFSEVDHLAAICWGCCMQYVMGKYEDAIHTLQKSMHVIKRHFEGVDDYLVTVKHRYSEYFVAQISLLIVGKLIGLWQCLLGKGSMIWHAAWANTHLFTMIKSCRVSFLFELNTESAFFYPSARHLSER